MRDDQLETGCTIYYLSTDLAHKLSYLSFFMGKNVNICIKSIEDTFNQACENCLLIIELGKIVISGLVLKIFHI